MAMTDPGAAPDRPLTRSDARTLVLAALGGALEFYDFVIFVFFTSVIAQLFFPPDTPDWLRQLQAFGLFAAGYLARPLGGILMAHFGDRSGRKRMFTLSVLLMAILGIGVADSMQRHTATKNVLALLVNAVAAVVFQPTPASVMPRRWRCWCCAFCRAPLSVAKCPAHGRLSPSTCPHGALVWRVAP